MGVNSNVQTFLQYRMMREQTRRLDALLDVHGLGEPSRFRRVQAALLRALDKVTGA